MSRIGKKPVAVPKNVKVRVDAGEIVVEGPVGTLRWGYPKAVTVEFNESGHQINVTRCDDERASRALHGLTRSLVNNMVQGVSQGFEKRLEIQGVGYQARLQGDRLEVAVGFAKPVQRKVPTGLTVTVPDPTHIVIKGPDKQRVGMFAAEVRKIRPPEPYQGKGIRYVGEQVRRKAGKAFASGG